MKHFLSILAFMMVTLAVQGTSHFVLNVEHYAAMGFLRSQAIMPLGLLAMLIQGLILTFGLSLWRAQNVSIRHGVMVSLAFGAFLASYIVLASPAKYAVPSVAEWMRVEGTASAIQFVVYGFILGFIHQRFPRNGH